MSIQPCQFVTPGAGSVCRLGLINVAVAVGINPEFSGERDQSRVFLTPKDPIDNGGHLGCAEGSSLQRGVGGNSKALPL